MFRDFAPSMVLTGLGLILVGCGYSAADRATSGALLGAGTGIALVALTGGNLLAGAVLGGAIGAAGGALTTRNNFRTDHPV